MQTHHPGGGSATHPATGMSVDELLQELVSIRHDVLNGNHDDSDTHSFHTSPATPRPDKTSTPLPKSSTTSPPSSPSQNQL